LKRALDGILSLIAATATPLPLALIARDETGILPNMIREDTFWGEHRDCSRRGHVVA
jgi:hypothetical protein